MPRFFLETINPEHITITGPDANHIGRALRMRIGETLTVCSEGKDYHCTITDIKPDLVTLRADSVELCAAEPSVSVTLYQALPKSDKFAQIIQKTIELGVTRIVPVLTQRCIARPDKSDFQKKLARLQGIAEAAAKQSGRGCIPEVAPLYTWKEALAELSQTDCGLLLYEGGGKRFDAIDLSEARHVGLLIGSEGGFDPTEAEEAIAAGIVPIWLGERILRCETAPLAAMSILMHRTGNL